MQFRFKRAGIIFLQILTFYCFGFSQTAEDFFKRGKEHQSKREYQSARNAFGEAIKLKADYAEAFFERGRTNQMSAGESPYSRLFSINDYRVKPILDDFQQAIYLSPNVANYYYHRGLNYYAASKFSEAIEDYTKAIALSPDQAEGYRMRFESYFQQGDFDKALSDINKAIELQPNTLPLFFGRGELFLSKDDCELFGLRKAVDEFSFIISRNPNFPIVYNKRAAAYKKLADCSRKTADEYERKAEKEERKKEEVWGTFINLRAKYLAQPVYPKDVIGLNEKVTVNVTVSGDGNITKATMLYGDSRFKAAAETAALASKFPPTIIGGKPIETWGVLEFNFIPPRTPGNGYGTGSGNGFDGNSKTYFITEKLETRRYLPGDTEPLAADKTFIFGELDLPTTNSATLFVGEKPSIELGDTPLKLLSLPKLVETEEARKNNVQGTVTLKVTFLADGKIGDISVVSGLPYGLNEAAISAAKKITFTPATKKGIPVTVTKNVQYKYELY